MSQTSDIEFLEYIDTSANRLAELSEENRQLRTKVADLSEEKVILQKVASSSIFEDEDVEAMVEKLAQGRLIDPLQSEKVASILKEDPKQFLKLMNKVADASLTHSSGGEGIARESEDPGSDPDGWSEMTRKRKHF